MRKFKVKVNGKEYEVEIEEIRAEENAAPEKDEGERAENKSEEE